VDDDDDSSTSATGARDVTGDEDRAEALTSQDCSSPITGQDYYPVHTDCASR
jgi:hypothetical protein